MSNLKNLSSCMLSDQMCYVNAAYRPQSCALLECGKGKCLAHTGTATPVAPGKPSSSLVVHQSFSTAVGIIIGVSCSLLIMVLTALVFVYLRNKYKVQAKKLNRRMMIIGNNTELVEEIEIQPITGQNIWAIQ
jgi:hypothetical protein